MTNKGLASLVAVLETCSHSELRVFIGQDKNVLNDFSAEIIEICQKNNVEYKIFKNTETIIPDEEGSYTIAISWKWLINLKKSQLIVLHDSLLPKYRGFNPLVSMLINKEPEIGVSVIYGAHKYDTGDIILQASRKIDYPILISTAVDIICEVYKELVGRLCDMITHSVSLPRVKHSDQEENYSLWRDSSDYLIDWDWDAQKISRMVDAVGFPYAGARTETTCGLVLTVKACRAISDVTIENRIAGKIIFWDDEGPTVVCGKSLIKIINYDIVRVSPSKNTAKLSFRSRFKSI